MNNKIDLDFLKISLFFIFNLNLRFTLPIINFKIREKVKFDFNTLVYFGALSSFNIFFLHCGNSLSSLINFFKKKNFNFTNQHVMMIRGKNLCGSFDYYKFVNFLCFKSVISYLNFIAGSSFEILFSEINLNYKNFNFANNFFFNFLNVFYEVGSESFKKNSVFINNSTLKLSSAYNCDLDFFNATIPLINIFEKSTLFLNIFGKISDFTYSFYRYFSSNFKNE